MHAVAGILQTIGHDDHNDLARSLFLRHCCQRGAQLRDRAPDGIQEGCAAPWRVCLLPRPRRLRERQLGSLGKLVESADASEQTVMSIAGHVSREMLAHYSHVRLEARRKAVAALDNGIITSQLAKWKADAEIRGKEQSHKSAGAGGK